MNFEILGPYRVLDVLGRGGMGTVYRGTHVKTEATVALKVIATSLADQERFRRRFATEVETLKRLKHPHIVQLLGYGEEQGHLFYAMEYVSGKTLSESIRFQGSLPWPRAIEIAIQIASALKHAHDFGIIHRDLKPANVLVSTDGQVKLTDFGIAKLFGNSEVTAAGSVLGTADFMPPEQAEGKAVTARSDLYALGALIFAMIAGRSPHHAKTIPEVLYNVRYQVPPRLNLLEATVPEELAELVAQLLMKQAAERPPTALVVGNRLLSLQHGLKKRPEEKSSAGSSGELQDAGESVSLEWSPEPGSDPSATSVARAELPTQAASAIVESPAGKSPSVPSSGAPSSSKTPIAAGEERQQSAPGSLPEENASSRFTLVDDAERWSSRMGELASATSGGRSQAWSIAVLVGLLLVCLMAIYYFARPRSADQLYEQIMTAVDSGQELSTLALEPTIAEFQRGYPEDPRLPAMAALQQQIEQQRAVRRLTRGGSGRRQGEAWTPLEQAFVECSQWNATNSAVALQKWQALLTIFSATPDLSTAEQALLVFAQREVERLSSDEQHRDAELADFLREQWSRAKSQLAPQEFAAFCRAVVELYGEKAWAREWVEQARPQAR
jgi:serine/threonine protein kinase